jgi:hypothetical protein
MLPHLTTLYTYLAFTLPSYFFFKGDKNGGDKNISPSKTIKIKKLRFAGGGLLTSPPFLCPKKQKKSTASKVTL